MGMARRLAVATSLGLAACAVAEDTAGPYLRERTSTITVVEVLPADDGR